MARIGYSSQARKIDATGSSGGGLVVERSERARMTLPARAVRAATASSQYVDLTDRILVHSEARTSRPRMVTGGVGGRGVSRIAISSPFL